MGNENTTTSYLDPPQLHGVQNKDGTYTLSALEMKKQSDFNYYVAKMLQGGLNLANLNKDTKQVFTDLNGDVTELGVTAQGLTLDVSNLSGDLTALSVTVDGMRIADESGSYTIIDGDKLESKDHDTGAATVIEDGEIKVYSDLDSFIWSGSVGYSYPGVFLVKNMDSTVPLKIEGIGNMSIDASAKIFIGTSSTASGNVDIGKTGGTINLNGTLLNNGNSLGAAVFT